MKTNIYFDEQFRLYDDENPRYRMANNVLYNIVEQYPSNTDQEQIVTKFWIIGRTYAAAIERRPNKKQTPGDFYYEYVAPTISSSELDTKINNIKNTYNEVNEDCLKEVLSLHGYLVSLIKGITTKEKRSLASKYLHFHLPELAFIFDSRVSKVIGKFVTKIPKNFIVEEGWDAVYSKFAYKAFEIYKTLKKQNFVSQYDTLPRVIDSFLLRYCDAHNISGDQED